MPSAKAAITTAVGFALAAVSAWSARADDLPRRAELGPGASFSAARRLVARTDRARELGLREASPSFDLAFDSEGAFELVPPLDRGCYLLLVEVDGGRLHVDGAPDVAPDRGLSLSLCGSDGAHLRGRALEGAVHARVAWMVADQDAADPASAPELLLVRAVFASRGMSLEPLADVVTTTAAVPVPMRVAEPGCFAVAGLARAAFELTLTGTRGEVLGRSVSVDPLPLVWHCAEEAGTFVAWVRNSPANGPVRLVVGREVGR